MTEKNSRTLLGFKKYFSGKGSKGSVACQIEKSFRSIVNIQETCRVQTMNKRKLSSLSLEGSSLANVLVVAIQLAAMEDLFSAKKLPRNRQTTFAFVRFSSGFWMKMEKFVARSVPF